jgi:hypothetical protein
MAAPARFPRFEIEELTHARAQEKWSKVCASTTPNENDFTDVGHLPRATLFDLIELRRQEARFSENGFIPLKVYFGQPRPDMSFEVDLRDPGLMPTPSQWLKTHYNGEGLVRMSYNTNSSYAVNDVRCLVIVLDHNATSFCAELSVPARVLVVKVVGRDAHPLVMMGRSGTNYHSEMDTARGFERAYAPNYLARVRQGPLVPTPPAPAVYPPPAHVRAPFTPLTAQPRLQAPVQVRQRAFQPGFAAGQLPIRAPGTGQVTIPPATAAALRQVQAMQSTSEGESTSPAEELPTPTKKKQTARKTTRSTVPKPKPRPQTARKTVQDISEESSSTPASTPDSSPTAQHPLTQLPVSQRVTQLTNDSSSSGSGSEMRSPNGQPIQPQTSTQNDDTIVISSEEGEATISSEDQQQQQDLNVAFTESGAESYSESEMKKKRSQKK